MVEVRVDSKEPAFALRKAFVTKKKNGTPVWKASSSVSLGTRVQTDVLWGIASQFSVEGR